jgi:hypothetical protein
MNFLRQLFCDHVFDVTEIKHLYTYKEYWAGTINAVYNTNALYKKCLKCGKEKITEQKSFSHLVSERERYFGTK